MAKRKRGPAAEILHRWLNAAVSGCLFAPVLSKRGESAVDHTSFETLTDEVPGLLDDAMLWAGQTNVALVVSFPRLHTEDDVVRLIACLRRSNRWSVAPDLNERPGCKPGVRIEMGWLTEAGQRSRVIGLAPLSSMPVTRRAPFVALCAWTGPIDANKYFKPRDRSIVGVANMPSLVTTKRGHTRNWKASTRSTTELLQLTGDASPGHGLTFRLDESLRTAVFPDLGMPAQA